MQEAYDEGLVSEEAITEAVERLMEVRIRLGMMKDYPSPYEDITYDKVECPEHVKLSVEAARRSLVLLKNENAFLPLDKNKIQTVAVIGPNANSRDALVGNYVGTSSRYLLRYVTLRFSRRRENALYELDLTASQSEVSSRMQEVQNLPEETWLRWWSAERVRRHRLSISVQKYQETILNIVSYML